MKVSREVESKFYSSSINNRFLPTTGETYQRRDGFPHKFDALRAVKICYHIDRKWYAVRLYKFPEHLPHKSLHRKKMAYLDIGKRQS